jgi:hypothetical protein
METEVEVSGRTGAGTSHVCTGRLGVWSCGCRQAWAPGASERSRKKRPPQSCTATTILYTQEGDWPEYNPLKAFMCVDQRCYSPSTVKQRSTSFWLLITRGLEDSTGTQICAREQDRGNGGMAGLEGHVSPEDTSLSSWAQRFGKVTLQSFLTWEQGCPGPGCRTYMPFTRDASKFNLNPW